MEHIGKVLATSITDHHYCRNYFYKKGSTHTSIKIGENNKNIIFRQNIRHLKITLFHKSSKKYNLKIVTYF